MEILPARSREDIVSSEKERLNLFKIINNLYLKDRKNIEQNPAKIVNMIVKNHLSQNPKQQTNLFVQDKEFGKLKRDEFKACINLETNGETINIPTSMFNSASSFHNWNGRIASNKKNGLDSNDVILKYARLKAKTMPRVINLSFFVYEDGSVYTLSGNAHRVAAAIRRGDKEVPFCGVFEVFLISSKNKPKIDYKNQSNDSRYF